MAVTCGFFNSLEHDRKYDARDFGQLFDGIIRDGVFMSIGTCMMVTANEGMLVTVGAGHAWFNTTWTTNDAPMVMEIPQSELLLNRIDTIVLEINNTVEVRNNSIKIIKGTPSSNAVRPELVNNNDVHQYPLCDIYVGAEVNEITTSNITNRVGTSDTPFVTGILETIEIDSLIAQWGSQWQDWVTATQNENAAWTAEQRAIYLTWASTQRSEFEAYVSLFETDMNDWKNLHYVGFDEWFEHIKGQLSTDAAGNLQNQIDDNYQKEFNRYYGIENKVTDINKNQYGDTLSIVETADEAICTTTFNTDASGNKEIVTIVVPTDGIYKYKKIVLIENVSTGKKITESYARLEKSIAS